ncbi:MAG TPA: T9SS type A sorting domain-containing protein, partial [Bacteroidetes bacterium]|nr:T9SS type A sorting domain-containing protein [Bacteroidota bacterium]
SKYNYDAFDDLFQLVDEDINLYPVITRGATYYAAFEITDENELPIENATIVFNGTDYFSDAEGVVVINDLDPMTYQYSAFKEGYVQEDGEIEIIDNNVDISIVLPLIPTYTVTFTITSSQGLVEGANIAFADNNYTTNSEGIAVITGVYSGDYSYSVTKDNYHERTGQLTVENTDKAETVSLTPVSVEGLLDNKLKLYPNPFTNQLTIDGIKNVERIVISNTIGQKVHEVKNSSDSHEINTSHLQKGIHLVTLHYNDGSRITRKLIKQ